MFDYTTATTSTTVNFLQRVGMASSRKTSTTATTTTTTTTFSTSTFIYSTTTLYSTVSPLYSFMFFLGVLSWIVLSCLMICLIVYCFKYWRKLQSPLTKVTFIIRHSNQYFFEMFHLQIVDAELGTVINPEFERPASIERPIEEAPVVTANRKYNTKDCRGLHTVVDRPESWHSHVNLQLYRNPELRETFIFN